jgi:hypothetical protein
MNRRTFLGTVAALAAGSRVAPAIELPPIVPPPAPVVPHPMAQAFYGGFAGAGKTRHMKEDHRRRMREIFDSCRSDDGDTLLELR